MWNNRSSNVGKSTLFNCLSNAKAQAANFPFCIIEPNVGVITVPDERLNKLVELVHPQKLFLPLSKSDGLSDCSGASKARRAW